MREIKLRAWDTNSKEMFIVDPVCWEEESAYHAGSDYSANAENAGWKLMQYTGLKDKNGVEIYEGDRWQRDSFIGVVEFKFSGWHFVIAEDSGCLLSPAFHSNAQYGEVIGNIYEDE